MKKLWIPNSAKTKFSQFLKRATENDMIKFYILQEQKHIGRQLTTEEVAELFKNRSVCPECERLQLREYVPTPDKKYQCPKCGKKSEPYPLHKYIIEGHYK